MHKVFARKALLDKGWSNNVRLEIAAGRIASVSSDSLPGAVAQLLDHPRVQSEPAPRSAGAVQQYRLQWGVNSEHRGDESLDTADFDDETGPGNLRVDYVLPSVELEMDGAGVFWPEREDPWFAPVGEKPFPASAHRLVWVDLRVD